MSVRYTFLRSSSSSCVMRSFTQKGRRSWTYLQQKWGGSGGGEAGDMIEAMHQRNRCGSGGDALASKIHGSELAA